MKRQLDEIPRVLERQPERVSHETVLTNPEWASGVLKATRELWEDLKGQYPFWTKGYMVFMSEIHEPLDLLLLGVNPGGGANSFKPEFADFVPEGHDYFRFHYPLADFMRSAFGPSRELQLRRSLKLNLNFFRSRDADEWKTAPAGVRRRMEVHSERYVLEALRRFRPPMVLCEGLQPFDHLSSVFGICTIETIVMAAGGRRAYVRAIGGLPWNGKLVGMIHPTGAHVSAGDRYRIERALHADLDLLPRAQLQS